MGKVKCRAGMSLEASLNACPSNFWAGESEKKPPQNPNKQTKEAIALTSA